MCIKIKNTRTIYIKSIVPQCNGSTQTKNEIKEINTFTKFSRRIKFL